MCQLRKVILTAATGELFDQDDPRVQFLWEHVLMSAIIADKLADARIPALGEGAYVSGLLHDLGKLIDKAKQTRRPMHELEVEGLTHFDHVTVGAKAAHAWNLGDHVIEAPRYHQELEHEISISVKRKKMVELVSLGIILPTISASASGSMKTLSWESSRA